MADAQYARVTQASPLLIRPRSSSVAMPAKRLAQATGLVVGDDVAYVLLDTVETIGVDGSTKVSGTPLVLGKPV